MKRGTNVAILALTIGGCSSSNGTQQSCIPSTGNTGKYVVSAWTVPAQSTDYAYDLNGDGVKDNALGAIIVALSAKGLDTQQGVTKAVSTGASVELIELDSSDATFQSDTCASVTGYVGQESASAPKFDGTDTFVKDTSVRASDQFTGPIQSGAFSSSSPVTATTPVTLTLELPLLSSATPIALDITSGQIEFTAQSGGGLMQGQLHGAIHNSDVQSKLIPDLARALSDEAATNAQVLTVFDTGGEADPSGTCPGTCKNPAGDWSGRMCAARGDKKIDTCEVATNATIKDLLSPDVQLFTADYSRSVPNTHMDSLSLGLGFTAVQASY